jgi:hypothetical protein
MLVNSYELRLQKYAHETVAQFLDYLRTFQRPVDISVRPQFISLIEAVQRRVDRLLSHGKPRREALRQRADDALSRQSHLKMSVRGARDGVHTLLLQCGSFLNRILHLHDTTRNRKMLIVATFAGLALMIVLFLKMGMSDRAGIELAGSVKASHSSPTRIPDWTIFDDAFANDPTRLATSKFVDQVRTSGAALTSDSAETTGQVMREPVPLPRPRPKRR